MRTLLVVDDEYVVLDALCMMLEGEGYRVRKASDGGEAWHRLDEEIPDAMLCDVQMPIADGVALMLRMGGDARLSRVPVLLMVEAFGTRPAGIERARRIIVKPVRFDELLEALRQEGLGPE